MRPTAGRDVGASDCPAGVGVGSSNVYHEYDKHELNESRGNSTIHAVLGDLQAAVFEL